MKFIIISIMAGIFLCSCGTTGENLTNASAIASGLAVSEILKDEDPLVRYGAAAGTGIGVKILGNKIMNNIEEGKQEAFKKGYEEARKDVAHEHYDLIQRLQRYQNGTGAQYRQYNLYEFPQPTKSGGINYMPSTSQLKLEE